MPYLLPAEGLKVYDPDAKGYLPTEGREMPAPLGKYWKRLLAEGAVTEVSAKPATKNSKPTDGEASH